MGSTAKGVIGSPLSNNGENEGAREIAIDRSTGVSDLSPPTVDLKDLDRASREEGQGLNGEHVAPAPKPSTHHLGLGAAKETVSGWIEAAGGKVSGTTLADSMDQEGRRTLENIFTEKIPKEFYGTVYHNAGIIIFAVLTTRVMTVLHMGWMGIVVLLAACMSIYSISIERTRARARDDIQRELTKVRLVTETETADWVNA